MNRKQQNISAKFSLPWFKIQRYETWWKKQHKKKKPKKKQDAPLKNG
jgi:hypothetical protein